MLAVAALPPDGTLGVPCFLAPGVAFAAAFFDTCVDVLGVACFAGPGLDLATVLTGGDLPPFDDNVLGVPRFPAPATILLPLGARAVEFLLALGAATVLAVEFFLALGALVVAAFFPLCVPRFPTPGAAFAAAVTVAASAAFLNGDACLAAVTVSPCGDRALGVPCFPAPGVALVADLTAIVSAAIFNVSAFPASADRALGVACFTALGVRL